MSTISSSCEVFQKLPGRIDGRANVRFMKWFSVKSSWRDSSSMIIVSLFLTLLTVAGSLAQDLIHKRVKSKVLPLSLMIPGSWESFPDSDGNSSEVLYLQNSDGDACEASVSLSTHEVPKKWDELVKRQNYQLIVWEGAPISHNQELRIRGAKGHKWVYKAKGEDGHQKLYYRLFLLLPKSVGERRFLVMDGTAPAVRSPEVLPLFNRMASSLAWGLQADTPIQTTP